MWDPRGRRCQTPSNIVHCKKDKIKILLPLIFSIDSTSVIAIKSTKNIIFLVWNTNLKLVTKNDLCNFSTVLRKFRHCLLMLKKFSFVLFCSRIVVDSAGSS